MTALCVSSLPHRHGDEGQEALAPAARLAPAAAARSALQAEAEAEAAGEVGLARPCSSTDLQAGPAAGPVAGPAAGPQLQQRRQRLQASVAGPQPATDHRPQHRAAAADHRTGPEGDVSRAPASEQGPCRAQPVSPAPRHCQAHRADVGHPAPKTPRAVLRAACRLARRVPSCAPRAVLRAACRAAAPSHLANTGHDQIQPCRGSFSCRPSSRGSRVVHGRASRLAAPAGAGSSVPPLEPPGGAACAVCRGPVWSGPAHGAAESGRALGRGGWVAGTSAWLGRAGLDCGWVARAVTSQALVTHPQ